MSRKKGRFYFNTKHVLTTNASEKHDLPHQAFALCDEEDALLQLLPASYRKTILNDAVFRVREIVLDFSKRPYALLHTGKREFIVEEETEIVDRNVIDKISEGLAFGQDNRAGMDGLLHRISAMRNKAGETYALTLRFGRAFANNAELVRDILLGEQYAKHSILILGPPGTGKTSVIRSVARLMSDHDQNVVIVDTSNEIAGDGDATHASLGLCRRMMVPDLEKQHRTMTEALQNHTPDVMVIDEISRKQEVQAAKTVKFRGVRLVASAHGTFSELAQNPDLNGLLGGKNQVILSAKEAKHEGGRKTRVERAGSPVFDIIIELVPGNYNQWRVIHDVGKAFDDLLSGNSYDVEERTRNGNLDNLKFNRQLLKQK
jgi:stage III sporulation protein SpoIIIAA